MMPHGDQPVPPPPPPDLPADALASYQPRRGAGSLARSQLAKVAEGLLASAAPGSRWQVKRSETAATEDRPTRDAPVTVPAPIEYTLERVVGRGGFGEVWESVQQSLGRKIAVKRLRDDLHERSLSDEGEARRLEIAFRQEALTAASLEHPNIVPVHDLGLDEDGRPLIAMKMVKGKPWNELLKEDRRKLDTREFLARHLPILINLCQAVAFAHSRGVIHRDLKPSQVMVGEFGEVLLMDWGLAVIYDEGLARKYVPQLLASGFVETTRNARNPAGTPSYMAPEQTEDTPEHLGPWTDVYLLGGILYNLLTGEVPHGTSTALDAFTQARLGLVRPPEDREAKREVPPELSALAGLALQPRSVQRLPSALALVRGIEEYLSGANKRRDSQQLTAEVARKAAKHGPKTYQELTRCVEKLDRAVGFWPENPEVAPLRRWALAELALTAVQNKDHVLARHMISQVEPGPQRDAMIQQIEPDEQVLLAVHRKSRHFAMAAIALGVSTAFLLLVLVLTAVLGYLMR
ncbi:serine/threonine protein kinase [Candidatus Poribacteria bacterium]|nr:serine/threonine protein kinase [Candidatus Poribacteria bacterium]